MTEKTIPGVYADIYRILKYLPHRYPFLLVDRVLECKTGETIRAIKNVTINEPFFNGHFPERPVMPGVLQLEALAQTAGILVYATLNKRPNENTRFYFAGIDECRFRRPVVPGDQLVLTAQVKRNMKGIWRLSTASYVNDQEATSAEMMLFPDAENASPMDPPTDPV